MSTIGLGLVGAGSIAGEHVLAMRRVPWVRLRSVTSRTPESAEAARERWGFEKSCSSVEEMLDDPLLDAVLLCTPHPLHAEQAIDVLKAGKGVIIEIPAALSLADLARVRDCAAQTGGRVFVCHTMRSFPALRWLRAELVRAGHTVHQVAGYFGIPRRNNEALSGQHRTWLDDIVWHHGTHLVDCAGWLLGTTRWRDPWARIGRVDEATGMVMDATCGYIAGNDTLVSHSLTYHCDEFRWGLRVHTDQGEFLFDNGRLTRRPDDRAILSGDVRDLIDQDLAIATAIRVGAPSEFDLAAISESLTLVAALDEGAKRSANR